MTRTEADTGEPKKLSEILDPALGRLTTSDQARAYGAWARAAGDTVAANARPRSFARGVLTVECASSIWAQELTYLGGRLLERMGEVDPGHPVERFRFVTRRSPPPPLCREDKAAPAANKPECEAAIAPATIEAARRAAEGVGDEHLRRAITVALEAVSAQPAKGPPDGPPVNPKK